MTRDTLSTLIRLAQTRAETAARQLGRLLHQEQEVEERLKLLTAYQAQYQARLLASVRSGLPRAALQNYQAFLETLDRAITQCREQLAAARIRRQSGQVQWQGEQRTLQSFQRLEERRRHAERVRNARVEQRQWDEHGARGAAAPWGKPTE
jgi:flagellar FliJ protein